MRILIVEDETGVAGFIEQGLTEAGYAVNVARDGSEGLEYALAYEYDVIVLDIMLPKMNGLDMLREIREKRVKSQAPLLTALPRGFSLIFPCSFVKSVRGMSRIVIWMTPMVIVPSCFFR